MGAAIPLPQTATVASDLNVVAADARAGKYFVFCLGQEEFAVSVDKVREILGVPEITAVPHSPEYLKGVMNLRGKVIPVVDLRLKLGMNATDLTERTCIVVMQIGSPKEPVRIGALVDSVAEVLAVTAGDVEDPPQLGRSGESLPNSHVLGLAKSRGRVQILLDIEKVLRGSDLSGSEDMPRGSRSQ